MIARPFNAEALVRRFLSVARFYRVRNNCDGTTTPCFILVKSIPGAAAGTVLGLAELHERLSYL